MTSTDIVIPRSDLPSDYSELMKTEAHHKHEIIMDKNGILRWKEDPFVTRLVAGCNLNNIINGFHANGADQNSEVYRELHRKMGYSLSGYWDIFYWQVNNDKAENYLPPTISEAEKPVALSVVAHFNVGEAAAIPPMLNGIKGEGTVFRNTHTNEGGVIVSTFCTGNIDLVVKSFTAHLAKNDISHLAIHRQGGINTL